MDKKNFFYISHKQIATHKFNHFIIIIFFSLININFSYSAISATTNKNILGSTPYFVLSDNLTEIREIKELLGFSMPILNPSSGVVERKQIDTSYSNVDIIASSDMKFSDIKLLIPADNKNYKLSEITTSIEDIDGDAEQTYSQGTMTATWYNNKGAVVENLYQTIDSCNSPYTLSIIANNVSANTVYGNPNSNTYGSGSTRYTFKVDKSEICYIKPLSIDIATVGTSLPKGFNPALFDSAKGFIISGLKLNNKIFPTTGFKGAEFTLLGTGDDQSKYRCNLENNTNDVSLSGNGNFYGGKNCTIRYETTTRFQSPITINMEHYDGVRWSKIDSYVIPLPTLWAIRGEEMAYANNNVLSEATLFPALSYCSGQTVTSINDTIYKNRQQYMFRRDEITNSLGSNQIDYPENTSPLIPNSQFSRDVDGTFMGEWGPVYKYDYSSANINMFYWTAEAYSNNQQFEIGTFGNIYSTNPDADYFLVMCRG